MKPRRLYPTPPPFFATLKAGRSLPRVCLAVTYSAKVNVESEWGGAPSPLAPLHAEAHAKQPAKSVPRNSSEPIGDRPSWPRSHRRIHPSMNARDLTVSGINVHCKVTPKKGAKTSKFSVRFCVGYDPDNHPPVKSWPGFGCSDNSDSSLIAKLQEKGVGRAAAGTNVLAELLCSLGFAYLSFANACCTHSSR